MATTKFKDMPVHLSGDFIATGAAAPDFELVKTDLGTLSLSSLKGKRVILNIFPSLDTGVCAMSVRKFNQLAASLPDTVVLAISKDLPFAHARFCTVEGIENLVPLSDFRHSDFDENYGVLMADGPLQGLLARSVVVIDREGKVVYTAGTRSRNHAGTRLRPRRRSGKEGLSPSEKHGGRHLLGCRRRVESTPPSDGTSLSAPRNGDSASRQAAPRRAYPGRFRASDRLRPDRKSTRKRCIYTFSWLRRLNRYSLSATFCQSTRSHQFFTNSARRLR